MRTVVALYDRLDHARDAVNELVDAGFPREDISMVASDATGEYKTYLEEHEGEDVVEGAAAGAAGGAVLGGLGGLLVGLGALAIPGVGPIVAAGPLAATLAGAGIGAAAGGLLGALAEWGIPEAEAGYYAEAVRRGGTLVAVRVPDNQVAQATKILEQYGPVDIERRAEYWRSEYGWKGYDRNAKPYTVDEVNRYRSELLDYDWEDDVDDDMDIDIVEEELAVGKRRRERPVRVHTYIVETPVEEDVTLREEHVEIERRRVDRPADEADFRERHVELTEYEEEAVAEKRARVIEEIHIKKDVDTHTETVRDTVRRTEVDIEQGEGWRGETDVDLPAWTEMETRFRRDFDTNYSGSGYTWQQYTPAYRYGYTLASDPRYMNRDWDEIESDVRTRWEARNEGTWDEFSGAIEYGWEQVKDALGVGPFKAGVDDPEDEGAHRRR